MASVVWSCLIFTNLSSFIFKFVIWLFSMYTNKILFYYLGYVFILELCLLSDYLPLWCHVLFFTFMDELYKQVFNNCKINVTMCKNSFYWLLYWIRNKYPLHLMTMFNVVQCTCHNFMNKVIVIIVIIFLKLLFFFKFSALANI